MKHKRLLLILAVLGGAVLACRLPGSSTTPEVSVTETPVYQIVTATPEESESPNVAPSPTVTQNSAQPTDTVPVPTETFTAPPPSPTPVLFSPSGFLTAASDYESVTIYNLLGQALAAVRTPGMSGGGSDNIYVGGSVENTFANVPVVFINMDNQGTIMQNLNGQLSELVLGPDITYLVGLPGEGVFAFTELTYANDALVSELYVYNLAMGGMNWVYERSDENYRSLYPLAIGEVGDTPVDIWTTHRMWGIGGDIVFPPQEGLFQLNIASQQEVQVLTPDFNPVGLSPDQRWVAYVPVGQGYGDGNNLQLTLYDLDTTVMVQIPLVPESDRGAGYAVFSPDNSYVAWMEGSGWQMAEVPNFTSRVRIADTDGNILADLPVNILASASGKSNPVWAKPVGWMDSETLIVEIRGDDWNNPALVKIRFDGSGISYLAPGGFAGFVYP